MSIKETLIHVRSDQQRQSAADALVAAMRADTFIVDIRPEFQRRRDGEIPEAIVIERNHLEWRLDPNSDARIPEAVDADVRWIVVCEGGYSSSLAVDSLRQIGLPHSTDVIGGFEAWNAAGISYRVPTRSRASTPGSSALSMLTATSPTRPPR